MARIRRAFRLFAAWFTAPASPVPLGAFRIALAAFGLVRMVPLRNSVLAIWGPYGFVQWAITRAGLPARVPHLGDVAALLAPLGVGAEATVWCVVGLEVAALVGLLLGWHTRAMAATAWGLDVLLLHAGGGLVYGMDVFTHIGLFYALLMPCGDALSLDARAGRRSPVPGVAAGATRRMLQIQLAIVYVSSGLEKASGVQWWNGDAIWRALMLPVFRQVDPSVLAWAPGLATAAGWLVLATEIGYGFALWSRKTRPLWLAATVGMHLFIGAFLGMWLFAGIMILLNLAAFGPEARVDLGAAVRRRATQATALALGTA